MTRLNEKIRILRERNGLTQAQLGEKLFLSEDAVYRWEKENGNVPRLAEIKLMCSLFHIPVETMTDDDFDLPGTGPLEEEEFDRLESRLSQDLIPQHNDSEHEVLDAGLRKGAKLHRFTNAAGVEYSAVYLGRMEALSCERDYERDMVNFWNETEY